MLLLCCLSVVSWGQKDKWMLYPAEVDFDAGPGFVPYNFSSPSSGLGAPYVVENSVFGENGELYFYIQNASIYDKDGVFYGNFSEPGLIKKEIGIAPVPGMCRTYCIFFIEALASATMCFKYVEIIIDDISGLPTFVSSAITADIYGGSHGSLAVSQAIGGIGGDRYIYVAANAWGELYRYRMTAAGLISEGVVATFPPSNDFESEVEISPCNRHLAWSTGSIAYVHDLLTGQLYSLSLGSRSFSGLEFIGHSNCRDLYLSHRVHGIVAWRFEQGQYIVLPGTQDFNLTQLERVKDGEFAMYLVKNGDDGGTLWKLNTDFITLEQVLAALPVYSGQYGGATDDVYALPDQIDGEGDDLFFGIAPIYVTSLSINQAPLPASYSAVPSFSDFDPIGLAITYQGIATSYSINIVSVDIVTGEPVFGPGYLDYQSSFTGAPPASIDLRCLESPALCDLFDGYAGQPFLLTVTVSGRCLYEGKASGYFQLFAPMAHPVAYDGSGRGCSLTPSASAVRSIAPSGETGAAYAYPNPTVGELNLSLPMPEGGDVALKIFDSSGRLILLREGYMERGGQPFGAYR
jgi:hypothetical protein